MLSPPYRKQVQLLLRVLPEIARESCFALHGGTAINLFLRDMPRLSVDVDLVYLPVEEREATLSNIEGALLRIKNNIKKVRQNLRRTGAAASAGFF